MTTNSRLSVQFVKIETLRFDMENPRIVHRPHAKSDEEMINALSREYPLWDLLTSIFASGIPEYEPLLVIADNDAFTVLDGNRRLAAMKILNDHVTYEKFLPYNILRFSRSNAIAKINEVPVLIASASDTNLWRSRLIRHAHLPVPWTSFARACFVQHIENTQGITTEHIGHLIGLERKDVDRLMDPIRLITFIEDRGVWKRSDVVGTRLYYSFLIKALSRSNILRHIGWDRKKSMKLINVLNTIELFTWLFGSRTKEKNTIIVEPDSDLDKLNIVLDSESALKALRSSNNLEEAYIYAIESRFALRRKLIQIDETIRSLIAESNEVPYPEPHVKTIAKSIRNTADILVRELENKSE
ncbi:hypothetical protein [Sphingobacterium micropteri]|nr:hypothetical protein [Sphingobacterium micropteri]